MDCQDVVYSNEYYDLIVDMSAESDFQEQNRCYQRLNQEFFSIYVKRDELPPLQIRNYPYATIPKLFTILDEQAMDASNILQIQNQPTLSLKGQGVLIGFVDTGIDYQNPVFRNVDGTSRIIAIWDQTLQEGINPEGFTYGTEYVKTQIDEALASEEPLRIVPTEDSNGHGSYIASLAAGGASSENAFIGAAPFAAIAVVKLKEAKEYLREFFFVRRDALAFQENDIMAGVAYLNELADKFHMPLVLCISLGTNLGSHGGSSPLSVTLDNLVRRRMRAVVIASGNEANKRHHFYGNISENDEFENVEISVGERVSGFTIELWTVVSEIFTVEVVSPTGERIPRLNIQDIFKDYSFIFEDTRVIIDKNLTFPGNDLQLIFIRFINPTQGIWNIRVYAEDIMQGVYEMWLPMEEFLDGEVFFIRSNPDTTITVPGNVRYPITVGGYDARNNSIYLDSGRGYTINGVIKPDLVAPAVEALGVGLHNRFVARTGSSGAAAITSGAVALIFEWAVVRGNYSRITSGDIKSILIRGAARDAQRLYPNREWGDYGNIVSS